MARHPQPRYFVVVSDGTAAGPYILLAGAPTALNAAQRTAQLYPEVDAEAFAATFNTESTSGLTLLGIGVAYRGEPGYAENDVGKRHRD